MVQRILALALSLGVILWIVLTYVPASLLPLPTIGFTNGGGLLAALALITLVAVVAIQVVILRSTARSIDATHQASDTRPPFRLNRNAELFWTALPLAMTFALAWAGYALWSHLLQP